MRIAFTFRHLDATDALKDYVADKLARVQRVLPGPAQAAVVLSTERFLQECDVTVTSAGKTFKGSQRSEDMYASVDRAVDRVERQVRKSKGRA
ncbi:MAG: ribosome-associated translation inhibitor RaiA [Myxococcota bacterium]|nr:ribosome-associated translation inhibitor RaiA [Myxococcota bacterium]